MGTGAIDLPNQDRITDREFSLSGVDGQNGNAARMHVQQLVDAIGLHSTAGSGPGSISGTKFEDLNGNGFRDPGERGLAGWRIFIDGNENQVFDSLMGGLEPDDFANGQDLSKGNNEVDLTEVDANNNFIGTNITAGGTGFASTGQLAFFSSVTTWRDTNRLRMQFSVPVTSVSIDAISDDSLDIGQMQIFDADDNLLGNYVTGNLAQFEVETMTLSSATPIAYAVAWGQGGQFLFLDNLRYSFEELSTTTDANGDYTFPLLPEGTHQLGEIPQAGWIQTAPRANRLFAVAQPTSEILEIDPVTFAVLNRFPHPGTQVAGATGLAFNGTTLFFTDRVNLFELNPNDGTVLDTDNLAALGAGTNIDALGFYGGQIVARDFIAELIHYIDPTLDVITSTVPISTSINSVGGVAAAPSRGSLFITELITDSIHEIDANTGSVLNSFPSPGGANELGLAFVDGALFVGDAAGGITRLDPNTGAFMGNRFYRTQFTSLGGDAGVDGFRTIYVAGQNVTGVDFGNVSDAPVALSMHINGDGGNRAGLGQITVQFNIPTNVTNPNIGLDLYNHTLGQLIVPGTMTLENNGRTQVIWNLNGFILPNGQYTAQLHHTAATGVASGKNLQWSKSVDFHVLAGDVSGDGVTNASDFVVIDFFFDPLPGPSFRSGDVNGDGLVNATDFRKADEFFNPLGTGLGPVLEYDFGDATEAGTNYRTTLANDGARHVVTGNTLTLGTIRDAEPDGQPNLTASGDGVDEEGMIISGNGGVLEVGSPVAIMLYSSGAGFVNAWIDYNLDGDWDDADEQVFINQFVTPGVNNLSITAPAGALTGNAFARFRLTTIPGYSYFGMAPDGEVEDYLIPIDDVVLPTASPARAPVVASGPADGDVIASANSRRQKAVNLTDDGDRESVIGRLQSLLFAPRPQSDLVSRFFSFLDGTDERDRIVK